MKFSINQQHLTTLRSNLGITLYLLPSVLRSDALLFYHFCQQLDHFIDNSPHSNLDKKKLTDQLLLALQEKPLINSFSPLLSAECAAMISRRQLPRELLCELVRGMQMDLTKNRYSSFEELYLYAWRVASTVGLMSTHLFEAKGKAVEEYAEILGIALQLTNILRDVGEDATRNRIYLPLEDLKRFAVREETLLTRKLSSEAKQLFHAQAERALLYFKKSAAAWEKLTALQRRQLRPARLMETFYHELLQKMRRDEFALFPNRYHLTFVEKLRLAWRVMILPSRYSQMTLKLQERT